MSSANLYNQRGSHHRSRAQRNAFSGCGFCRRNKEPEHIYNSHQLKDDQGQVICPQLYKYICELCGATGANAHTRSYCPTAGNLRKLTNGTAHVEPTNGAGCRATTSRDTEPAGFGYPDATTCLAQKKRGQQRPGFAGGQVNSWNLQMDNFRGSELIQVSNARLFGNMGAVSNSRYNSAGMRRTRPNDPHHRR